MTDTWMDAFRGMEGKKTEHRSVVLIKKYDANDEMRISDVFANAALMSISRTSVSLDRPQIETQRHNNGGMTKSVTFACHTEKSAFEKRIQHELTAFRGMKWCLNKG